MQIEANIKRSDIFRFIVFHSKSRPLYLSICIIGYGIALWSQWHSQDCPRGWFEIAYVLAYYAAYFGGIFCLSVLFITIASIVRCNSTLGIIGIHKFEIRDEGFYEESVANQTLTRWIAIKKTARDKHQIIVWVASWLFHVIPRRSFKTEEEYASFYDELLKHSRKTA